MSDQPNYFPEGNRRTYYPYSAVQEESRRRSEATQRAIEESRKRDAALAEQREQERLARAAGELDAHIEQARQRWIAATGSEVGFAAEIPRLRAQFAERGSLVDQIRAEMRASGQYGRVV
jgi:hypothetical protein